MFAPRVIHQSPLPGVQNCIFTGLTDGPFVDTNVNIEWNPNGLRGLIQLDIARQIGGAAGMLREEHLKTALEARDAALARVEELEAECNEQARTIAAIEQLQSNDFVARKRKGPRPAVA